jgi:hypothetical protein
MDVLTPEEINAVVNASRLKNKYEQLVDSESAYEILNRKLEKAAEPENIEATETPAREATKSESPRNPREKSIAEKVMDSSVTRQIGRTAASILTRSLLGALGLGGRSRSRKSIF